MPPAAGPGPAPCPRRCWPGLRRPASGCCSRLAAGCLRACSLEDHFAGGMLQSSMPSPGLGACSLHLTAGCRQLAWNPLLTQVLQHGNPTGEARRLLGSTAVSLSEFESAVCTAGLLHTSSIIETSGFAVVGCCVSHCKACKGQTASKEHCVHQLQGTPLCRICVRCAHHPGRACCG